MSRFRVATLALISLALAPLVGRAQELTLTQHTLPQPFLQEGVVDGVLEASGVEPIGDGGRFLVAHDKAPGLYVVELASGRVLGSPLGSARFPVQNGAGPKWEGMALDSEGVFYIIGAHNGKTDEERATKSHLLKFRLKAQDEPAIDDGSVVGYHVARSIESALKAEGVAAELVAQRKVEGLTIRERKGADGSIRRELLIGLRAPTDRVRVFAADLSAPPSPDAELDLKPLFSFEAERREGFVSELTAMEYAPTLKGTLVMTASEDKNNAFHGNTLYFIADGVSDHATKVAVLEPAMKCEGLTILGTQAEAGGIKVKLLFTFDNDPHATKIPSRFQTAVLERR